VADPQTERAKINGERKMVEAELGPIRYLTTLIGAGDRALLIGHHFWRSALCRAPSASGVCSSRGKSSSFHHGLRASELVALRWSDVKFQGQRHRSEPPQKRPLESAAARSGRPAESQGALPRSKPGANAIGIERGGVPIHSNPGSNADFERIVGPVAARTPQQGDGGWGGWHGALINKLRSGEHGLARIAPALHIAETMKAARSLRICNAEIVATPHLG
jgi:hypothetical protein